MRKKKSNRKNEKRFWFQELENAITYSKSEDQEQAIRKYKKGDEVESIILSVDSDRERVSLGIKQLEDQAPSD